MCFDTRLSQPGQEYSSLADFWQKDLGRQGAHLLDLTSSPRRGLQKELTWRRARHLKLELRRLLDVDGKAAHESAGGPGSSGFLLAPMDMKCLMLNSRWKIAVRRRLLCKPQEVLGICSVTTHCKLRAKCGTICGKPIGTNGAHLVSCKKGGGVMRVHDEVRDALCTWAEKLLPYAPRTEQQLSGDPPGDAELDDDEDLSSPDNVLDIAWYDEAGLKAVDIVITNPVREDAAKTRMAARTPGAMAARAERAKHRRYPEVSLVPFAIESMGRWGEEALAWVRAVANQADPATASQQVAHLMQQVSCIVQGSVAQRLVEATQPHGQQVAMESRLA